MTEIAGDELTAFYVTASFWYSSYQKGRFLSISGENPCYFTFPAYLNWISVSNKVTVADEDTLSKISL